MVSLVVCELFEVVGCLWWLGVDLEWWLEELSERCKLFDDVSYLTMSLIIDIIGLSSMMNKRNYLLASLDVEVNLVSVR